MLDYQIDPRIIAGQATLKADSQKTKDLASLKKSCQEFESMFLCEMVKAMRKTIPDGGLLPKDNATEIFQEMLDTETIRQGSSSQSLGIADAMYDQMAKLIENKK
jgi:flagellar protein FlgJ